MQKSNKRKMKKKTISIFCKYWNNLLFMESAAFFLSVQLLESLPACHRASSRCCKPVIAHVMRPQRVQQVSHTSAVTANCDSTTGCCHRRPSDASRPSRRCSYIRCLESRLWPARPVGYLPGQTWEQQRRARDEKLKLEENRRAEFLLDWTFLRSSATHPSEQRAHSENVS